MSVIHYINKHGKYLYTDFGESLERVSDKSDYFVDYDISKLSKCIDNANYVEILENKLSFVKLSKNIGVNKKLIKLLQQFFSFR